ncbi:ATPase [Pseudomonas sp. GL93]|uniref:CHASE2 domain-containing protein n=1 Tax=Pseudomonas sp. GL93 TaxID=2014741 RepID=UPI000E30D56C|nr:CHASE2 domain-containing protein [Pseudomonas sp. GL93]RFD32528.1 ATPase [Pseudomonas sp. GL93]
MLSVQQLLRRIFWEWVIIAVLLLPCVGLLAYQSSSTADRFIYDTLMQLNLAPTDSRIVLVTIDDASIAAIGRWPWPRDKHVQLLNKLAQLSPESVLYDIIFTEPDPDPEVDVRLGAAMARVGKVMVPTLRNPTIQPGELPHFIMPIQPVLQGAEAVGQIYVAADVDGVVRRVFLKEGNLNGQLNHLTWLAYTSTFPADKQPTMPSTSSLTHLGGEWFGTHEVLIPFSRISPFKNRVSAVDVLNGNIPAELLRGKIILVGATASGLGDRYPTPVTASEGTTAGVAIQAQLLNGILTNRLITNVPTWVSASLSIALVLIALGLLLTSRLRLTFLISLSFIFTCLLLSFDMLLLGVWWSPVSSITGIALAYLFWSWRRLNAVVTYFGLEVDRLSHELKSQSVLPKPAHHGDKLVRRTLALEAMIDHTRNSRRFIAQSLDSLPQAIFVTDLKGKILLANLSASTLQANESQDKTKAPSQDIFQVLSCLEGVDETGDVPRIAERLAGRVVLTPSGRSFKVQISPLDTAPSGSTGWLIGLVEFTVERLAEEQRDSMLRFLSHDLRAPQSAILALLAMQEKSMVSLPIGELRRHIEHQVRRTLKLTESFMLLDTAKSKELEVEEVLMAALVMDVVDQAWPLARNKNIHFKQDIVDDESCVVMGSHELLTRAIFNLVENAIKYSEPRTTIHLNLSFQDGEVILRVQDEGQGISEEDLPHLFDEFRQFGKGSKKGHGYGLGMAFVYKVMQRHGARIECSSQLNVGTVFTLYFQPALPLD